MKTLMCRVLKIYNSRNYKRPIAEIEDLVEKCLNLQ